MNGVTGRMGRNQHLLRSIIPIIQQGGVKVHDHHFILPEPILVGRHRSKLENLSNLSGIGNYTTDLNGLLSDSNYPVYFDAQKTSRRFQAIKNAIAAGKHVYCEKPAAETVDEALELFLLAQKAERKNGVVQDKLWLPGILKLRNLIETGFFGRILSIRGDFGYWVFEGNGAPAQRPSWNYKKEEGGGIILDMFCHWQYVLENLFGRIKAVSCLGATHIKKRFDEQGQLYTCTADDAAYAMFMLENEVIAQFNSSWCVRVRRDDLLTLQVDGTRGSAVTGLRDCFIQPYDATPRPVWNPDVKNPIHFWDAWVPIREHEDYENAFKKQWELFLRHIVLDEPFPWTLLQAAKGVQLAELALKSWNERRWLDIPKLS